MKVFLVWHGEYEESCVHAAFSNLEAAQEFGVQLNSHFNPADLYQKLRMESTFIEELTLDIPDDEHQRYDLACEVGHG